MHLLTRRPLTHPPLNNNAVDQRLVFHPFLFPIEYLEAQIISNRILLMRKRGSMTMNIDADCALMYWMSSAAKAESKKRRSHETLVERIRVGNLPDWAYGSDSLIHVLVTSDAERVQRKGVRCHLAKAGMPASSFAYADGGVPLVSPECCFLRLARQLSVPELAKTGMLLCASFSFDEERGLVGRRDSLTSAKLLATYISKAGNSAGVKVARRALRFVTDNAASPPEIDASLLLCLPVMLGGYGCPLPELNGHVKLRAEVARTLGYTDCYGDLLWRDAKCIVEYTSEQYHTGYRKQANDEMRRAALEAMGYRVFLLTKPQLYNQVAFEGFAQSVLRTLGKRMPKRTSKFQQAQYDLRKMLLFEPSSILRRACRM